jgi:hypothetical protein
MPGLVRTKSVGLPTMGGVKTSRKVPTIGSVGRMIRAYELTRGGARSYDLIRMRKENVAAAKHMRNMAAFHKGFVSDSVKAQICKHIMRSPRRQS